MMLKPSSMEIASYLGDPTEIPSFFHQKRTQKGHWLRIRKKILARECNPAGALILDFPAKALQQGDWWGIERGRRLAEQLEHRKYNTYHCLSITCLASQLLYYIFHFISSSHIHRATTWERLVCGRILAKYPENLGWNPNPAYYYLCSLSKSLQNFDLYFSHP